MNTNDVDSYLRDGCGRCDKSHGYPGCILQVDCAKQPATRHRRLEKCVPKIYDGKGFNER